VNIIDIDAGKEKKEKDCYATKLGEQRRKPSANKFKNCSLLNMEQCLIQRLVKTSMTSNSSFRSKGNTTNP
jgi:hypothetical protein